MDDGQWLTAGRAPPDGKNLEQHPQQVNTCTSEGASVSEGLVLRS